MKEDEKTVEVRPNWGERNARRLRNLGIAALALGGLLALPLAVEAGGAGIVAGQVVYDSERDLRQTKTKHQKETKGD
jgi:hypothetical protein